MNIFFNKIVMESFIDFGGLHFISYKCSTKLLSVNKFFNKKCTDYLYKYEDYSMAQYKEGMKNIVCYPENSDQLIKLNGKDLDFLELYCSIPENFVLPRNLKKLIMRADTGKIKEYPQSLQELYLWCDRNENLPMFPSNLKKLCINGPFRLDKKTILPDSLETILMEELIVILPIKLPRSLKSINIGGSGFNLLEFPESLESLRIGLGQTIGNIKYPRNLLELSLHGSSRIVGLPETLVKLSLNDGLTTQTKFPHNLKKLTISGSVYFDLEFPPNLEYLHMGQCKCNFNLKLNNKVESVWLPSNFNKEINIPKSVQFIDFGSNYDKDISLPENVKEIILRERYSKLLALPKSFKSLLFKNKIKISFKGNIFTIRGSLFLKDE